MSEGIKYAVVNNVTASLVVAVWSNVVSREFVLETLAALRKQLGDVPQDVLDLIDQRVEEARFIAPEPLTK